jgi:hypothetical protein
MLLQKSPSIEELIVQILSKEGDLQPKGINDRIIQSGYAYSQRGIYKELKKLESEGVIFKSSKGYSLQLTWIINILNFADQAYETSTKFTPLKQILQEESLKTVYRFNNLRRMDLFWIQTLMTLHQMNPKEPLFLWCPFQWFDLVHNHATNSFYSASDITSAKRYHIIGDDSFLSRKALEALPKNGHYSFSESPFSKEKNTYYAVIASTVITVKLDTPGTERIASLFDRVKNNQDLKKENISQIFNQKVKVSLTIENNMLKSKKLRKKFCDFFGV